MAHDANKPDGAVDRLIAYITANNYSTGDRLPSIKDLAVELELSPHAVRDALLEAQTVGLVRVQPRSGAYVQSVSFSPLVAAFTKMLPRSLTGDDNNLLDLLEARRMIEADLVEMAAARRRLADLVPVRNALQGMYADTADYDAYVRLNEEFHLGLARIAGNQVLLIILRHLLQLLRAVLVERQPANWRDEASAKRETDAREHEAVYSAVLASDPGAARTAMLVHLRDTTESLLPTYATKPH
ncbi:MAG: FadR family transcriptional regulator [Planctomycetes bacterium]|nr:FadR family transcriptional regulator [Planctomycetota bacterium]